MIGDFQILLQWGLFPLYQLSEQEHVSCTSFADHYYHIVEKDKCSLLICKSTRHTFFPGPNVRLRQKNTSPVEEWALFIAGVALQALRLFDRITNSSWAFCISFNATKSGAIGSMYGVCCSCLKRISSTKLPSFFSGFRHTQYRIG